MITARVNTLHGSYMNLHGFIQDRPTFLQTEYR